MTLNDTFSLPLAVAGAEMTGTRFVFAIVMTVLAGVALPAGTFTSTAVQFTVYVPACVKFGVPVKVMLGFNAGPAELEAVRKPVAFD